MNIALFKEVPHLVNRPKTPEVLFGELKNLLKQEETNADITALAPLNILDDIEEAKSWFTALWKQEPPTQPIQAIHFGLAQLREHGWVFYVAGYNQRGEVAGTGDWWPPGRYANTAVLKEINNLIDQGVLAERWTAEVVLIQGYGCLLTKALAPLVQALIGDVQITTGFDEGDLLVLTENGFVNL